MPYVAFQRSAAEQRYLEFRCKFPESADFRLNAMLTHFSAEWRMGLALTLSYGNSVLVKIDGENLQEVIKAIKEWRVEWLQEFDPESHLPPTDPAAPYIKTIEILTERPPSPPPMEQRH